MSPDSMPLKLLLCVFSAWVNRRQGQVIDYLVEENRVLKEQLRGKRLRLTDKQRRADRRFKPSFPGRGVTRTVRGKAGEAESVCERGMRSRSSSRSPPVKAQIARCAAGTPRPRAMRTGARARVAGAQAPRLADPREGPGARGWRAAPADPSRTSEPAGDHRSARTPAHRP